METNEQHRRLLTKHNRIDEQGSDDRQNHDVMNAMAHAMVDDTKKGTNLLRLHSMDVNNKDDADADAHEGMHAHHIHAHPSSHMHHMDPSLVVFFMMGDLKEGKTMPIYFPKRDPSSPHLLPKEEADQIPFSLKQLPNLLQHFSFSQASPQAKAMEETLTQCEFKPIKGETKLCATSLESMLDFTRGIIGLDAQVKVLSTTHLTKSTTLLQNYTVLQDPIEIPAPKMVACHTMPYPYAVFYCHSQVTENRVLRISLEGENGDRVEAISVCHLDTSHWSRDHVSFRVLGIEPGTSPVCHFFPADNFVWVQSTTLI